jgi:DNA-directed RNA polymerase alpha subunit
MSARSLTVRLPENLWRAVQVLTPHEGDPDTVILRAVEEYVTTAAIKQNNRPGRYRDQVHTLSTPVADLHLSARPASALQMLHLRYVYELVQKAPPPPDLFQLPNFWIKSLKEIEDKMAMLELTLGMTLEDAADREAAEATVAANLQATKE